MDTVSRSGKKFALKSAGGKTIEPLFDCVVIASAAEPSLSSTPMMIFWAHRTIGINRTPFQPALSPVLTQDQAVGTIQGVRLDAAVTLLRNGEKIAQTYGNVIFTEKGINGPGVMNLSHHVNTKNDHYALSFDFLSDSDQKEIETRFYQERERNLPYRNLFLAYLPDKLVDCCLKSFMVNDNLLLPGVLIKAFYRHLRWLRNFTVPVKANESFRLAQVCSGGVNLHEISLQTMESKKIQGLFFAGEVLDIIGNCGGYNLHWAIASGCAAAEGVICRLATRSS